MAAAKDTDDDDTIIKPIDISANHKHKSVQSTLTPNGIFGEEDAEEIMTASPKPIGKIARRDLRNF